MEKDVLDAPGAVASLRARSGRCGVLFGGEKSGLPNEAVSLCDAILTYPVNPGFASMNLAQAVGVFCHQWGAGEGLGVEFVPSTRDGLIATANDVVEDLFEQRGWLPDDIALLTTAHRHEIQKMLDHDKDAYWASLWENDVFHCTVAGFKGLERPAIVLVVDGFHDGVVPAQVMYVGMSRARDLLVVVGDPEEIESAVGPAVMKRLRERAREQSDPALR
jgi:hypothetical protein